MGNNVRGCGAALAPITLVIGRISPCAEVIELGFMVLLLSNYWW
jgi:hypothetical protein